MPSLLLVFSGCEYLDPEKVGAYTCDEYCAQVIEKTEACAEQQCDEDPDCAEYGESYLAEYAAEGRDDWQGASRQEMLQSCNADVEEAGKSDSACQTETAVINNLSCDDILGLLGEIRAAAE